MERLDSPGRRFLRHAAAATCAGGVVLTVIGVLNGGSLLQGSLEWFRRIGGSGAVSAGARAELARQAPTLFYAVLYDAALGLVLGLAWGLLVGAYAALRRAPVPKRGGLASWHLSLFFWLPFLLAATAGYALKRQEMRPVAEAILRQRLALRLPVMVLVLWGCHRITAALFRWLGRKRPFRPLASGRTAAIVALGFVVLLTLASFLPPRLVAEPARAPLGAPLARAPGAPNVLLLVLDTVRADHLGVYGYQRATTPNLDALARRGRVYDHAYTAGVWTLTGHASLFTGRVPTRSGVNEEDLFFGEDFSTMASVLARAGYETVGFCNNAWIAPWTGTDRGFQDLRMMWRRPYNVNLTLGAMALQYSHWRRTGDQAVGGVVKTAAEVLDWLSRRDRARPFFAFVNLLEAHIPLDYREEFTGPLVPPGMDRLALRNVNQNPYALWSGKASMTPEDFERYAVLYDGELRYLDHHLGRFFGDLERRGVFDDTVVLITADHGELMGDHGALGHHMALWEGLLRVPLIVIDPAHPGGGVRIAQTVSTIDLFPTMLERLGIRDAATEAALQGRPLATEDLGEPGVAIAEELKPLFEISMMRGGDAKVDLDATYAHRHRAFVKGRWKLLQREGGEEQLYDLAADPGETRDLVTERADVALSMRSDLEEWLARHPAVGTPEGFQFTPDGAAREQLRNLGYVQ